MIGSFNNSELLLPKNESLMVFGNLSGTDIAFNESDINYSGSSDILNERDIYDSELSDIFNTTAAVDVVTELPFRIETLINSTRDTVGKC